MRSRADSRRRRRRRRPPRENARVDAPELRIARLEWRLDALDAWRKDIDAMVLSNRAKLQEIVKADELAELLADKLDDRTGAALTHEGIRVQKWQVYVASCAILIGLFSPLIEKAIG